MKNNYKISPRSFSNLHAKPKFNNFVSCSTYAQSKVNELIAVAYETKRIHYLKANSSSINLIPIPAASATNKDKLQYQTISAVILFLSKSTMTNKKKELLKKLENLVRRLSPNNEVN